MNGSPLFVHFWLFCGLWVGVGGAIYYYFSNQRKVREGILDEVSLRNFCIGWCAVMLSASVVFWIIQILAKADSPFYADEPYYSISRAITVILWVLMLGWVFLHDGAAVLTKYMNVSSGKFMNFELTETRVKIAAVVVVASGIYSLWMSHGAL